MSSESIYLIRSSDGAAVEATLLGGLKPANLELVERVWSIKRQEMLRALLVGKVDQTQWPQSLHWNWGNKAAELNLLAYQGWAIECDGDFQGVMMVELVGHTADHEEDRGKPLLYIEYLESAPWNWNCRQLGQVRKYRGIGQILFQKAVELSQEEGFHGRVGLHALPQAEGFYEQACGMTRFGPDPDKQRLVYYELSRGAAAARLKTEDER